jgi:hypothetical protein
MFNKQFATLDLFKLKYIFNSQIEHRNITNFKTGGTLKYDRFCEYEGAMSTCSSAICTALHGYN